MTVDDLLLLAEGWDFEAKLASGRDGRGELPASFWPSYGAMANSQGGWIVLGVRERDDRSLEVVGLQDPAKVERELWDLLENRQKVSTNVLRRDDVRFQDMDGRRVVVVKVPRARRQDRPVYIDDDLWRGTYLRVHEGDRHAAPERVRRMVAEAELDSRDDLVLPRFGPGDLAAQTVEAYRNIFGSRSPDHPWRRLDDEDFLRQVGALRRDREDGSEGLTRAGLLMFGTFDAICEVFPAFFLDYQERAVASEVIEWTDRVFPDGTWSGNLFDFYGRVILKLTADVRSPFSSPRACSGRTIPTSTRPCARRSSTRSSTPTTKQLRRSS